VRGAAQVTVNDTMKIVHENESSTSRSDRCTGWKPGKIMPELIEFGEDDIIRIEDDYQRV
jgi:mannose-1-phosphate guanylyltransferase / mannose-6-phosphate isomerase